MAGRIDLIIGPMFSGKTGELLMRARRETIADHRVIIVKHSEDTRYTKDEVVKSHDAMSLCTGGQIRVVIATSLKDVVLGPEESVVCIDEGQFFPDLMTCDAWAQEGRHVIVAALDATSKRLPFGQVCELIPRCENVKKLSGVCMICRRQPSSFSKFREARSDADPVVCVGGAETYISVCRECYKL